MAKYHKYVFDVKKREFIGNFEEMYQSEMKENFDSWYQDDTRHLPRKIVFDILNDYNFKNIIDLGCGKGSLTHVLKKKNNSVTALDISETAINTAKEKYPDIKFVCMDINDVDAFGKYVSDREEKTNLIISRELFSYLKNWKKILKIISEATEYFLISLDMPHNPIGFVKSEKELYSEIEKYFEIIECIKLYKHQHIIIFSRNKA